MALDVEVPEPPDLSNRGMPREFELQEETLGSEDFYREDLEDLLQEGACKEGFNEWAEYTDLDEGQVRIVSDLGLFQAFDFYWDSTEDRLRFDAPTIPDDWRERDATESLDFVASGAAVATASTTSLPAQVGPNTPPVENGTAANETIIALTYDTGLRVGKLVDVDVEMLREGNSELYPAGHIQKDYPNDNSPGPVTIELSTPLRP